MKTVVQILTEARELLSDESRWTRGEYHSVELCQKAIAQLDVEPNHTRCIITKEKN